MICIIGGKGSIGSRYATILKWNNVRHVVLDMDNKDQINLADYNKFIIACPTDEHLPYIKALVAAGKTFLCEKPVARTPAAIPDYELGFTVCNWKYVAHLMRQEAPFEIEYDYYKTGPDGIHWDLAQVLYLDPNAKINNKSPKWNVAINGTFVAYRTLEESYVRMLLDFCSGNYKNLWTLKQGREMSEAVLDRMNRDLAAGKSV